MKKWLSLFHQLAHSSSISSKADVINEFHISQTHLVSVSMMTNKDIEEWHAEHRPHVSDDEAGGWNWNFILYAAQMSDLFFQDPRTYAFRLNGVLVGMLLVARKYPAELTDGRTINDFVWYVEKTPLFSKMLKRLECPSFSLLRLAFEVVRQESHENPPWSLWLHADSKGGHGLIKTYSRLGLVPFKFKLYGLKDRYTCRRWNLFSSSDQSPYMHMKDGALDENAQTVKERYGTI